MNWPQTYTTIPAVCSMLGISKSAFLDLVRTKQLDVFHAGGTNRPRVLNNQKLHALVLELKWKKEKEQAEQQQLELFRKQYMECVEKTGKLFVQSSASS